MINPLTVLYVYHSDLSQHVFDRTVRLSVIYHGMSLTVLYVYHSDLSWYVSDRTVGLSVIYHGN
jgi:hypothetical protein